MSLKADVVTIRLDIPRDYRVSDCGRAAFLPVPYVIKGAVGARRILDDSLLTYLMTFAGKILLRRVSHFVERVSG